MKRRQLLLAPAALDDVEAAITLIRSAAGAERAAKFLSRVETFIRRLAEFAEIGTRHDNRHKGLRTVGIPGLPRISIVFVVTPEQVTVVRVGYLGQDVLGKRATFEVDDPIDVLSGKR